MVDRILVTGGSGMLGSHIAQRLVAAGHAVTSIDLRSPADRDAPWATVEGDIRDLDLLTTLMRTSDAVVHTAAALPSYAPELIRAIIVDGTDTVLRAAHAAEVARLVHISSTAVYGLPKVVPTPETHPREPVDHYTRAKAAAEELVERYRADGMCIPVLRPKTFLGPGRMGLFSMLFEWAQDGRNFPVLGRGDVRIQMLSVEDLVDMVELVLEADPEVAGDTYNVGAAEFGTIREDFQAVLDAAGRGKRVVSLPLRPALFGLKALERAHVSPVYGRLIDKLCNDSFVSIEKAGRQLGFKPRFSNRDAILATYEWWREARASAGPVRSSGRTSSDRWRQGALGAVRFLF